MIKIIVVEPGTVVRGIEITDTTVALDKWRGVLYCTRTIAEGLKALGDAWSW